jgi:hypothetical protein
MTQSNLIAIVGQKYETVDRQIVICLLNDAPGSKPNIMMNVSNGDVYSVDKDLRRWSFGSKNDEDVHAMLSDEESLETMANAEVIKRKLDIYKKASLPPTKEKINYASKWIRSRNPIMLGLLLGTIMTAPLLAMVIGHMGVIGVLCILLSLVIAIPSFMDSY